MRRAADDRRREICSASRVYNSSAFPACTIGVRREVPQVRVISEIERDSAAYSYDGVRARVRQGGLFR